MQRTTDITADEARALVAGVGVIAVEDNPPNCGWDLQLGPADGRSLAFWAECDEGNAYWLLLSGVTDA